MGPNLGDYAEDDTVYFLWSSNGANGASITRATNGTVSVYKDNGTTQSTAGVTDTEDFDSLTGIHACTIDTSADAFYTAGADYAVVLSAATIDGQTVNAVLAHFSIENRTLKSGGIKSSTFAAGAINAAAIADNAIDAGAIASDAITSAKIADNAITAGKIAADAITSAKIADGAIDAATFAAGAINAAAIAADAITAAKIADGAIDANTFAAGAITASAIAADAIGASELAADAVAEIADAVWDEAIAGHAGAGSTGEALSAAGSAGDPWTTALPGAYGAGTAGKIIGDNINATISSRATQASVDTVDGIVDDILVDTAEIGAAGAGLTNINLPNQTMDIVGSITGNLSGSVGSVTGNVGGNVAGSVASVTAAVTVGTNNDKTGYRLSATGVDDVLDEVVTGTTTFRQAVRGWIAALLGKSSGLETTTAVYRNIADDKDVISATVDADGNRSAVTLDLT